MNSGQDHAKLLDLAYEHYMKLLDLLFRVMEANRGALTGTDHRFWYAEGLVTKFFFHAASVLYLSRETELSDFPSARLRFLDPASIDVLARAAIETFLVFHYVFVMPNTPEEQDCRYWAWKAAGLMGRQSLPVSTQEHRQKLTAERKDIDDLHTKLRSNAAFQQLTEKQKKRVLKKGEWRLLNWREIAESANLARTLSSDMYRHLSGHAHSSSLSILQLKQSLNNKEQLLLIRASMSTITIAVANFVREYCDLFPRAKAALAAEAEASDIVDMWIQVGQKLDVKDHNGDENS